MRFLSAFAASSSRGTGRGGYPGAGSSAIPRVRTRKLSTVQGLGGGDSGLLGADPWVERRSAGVRRGKSAEHAQDGDRGADDGGEDHAGLREHGAGEPPCQAGLQLGEPGLELVGRHVVSVVGCLSHGGRDGVGELRVGAGGDQGAGDSVGCREWPCVLPPV